MQELFQSKKKDLTRFEKKRAYIDTKGFATKSCCANPNGYFDAKISSKVENFC